MTSAKRIFATVLTVAVALTSINFAGWGTIAYAETAATADSAVTAESEATETPTEVTIVDSGYCGPTTNETTLKRIWWELDSAGTLTFYGKGAMQNYTHDIYNDKVSSPFSRNASIKKVVFSEGITRTGNYMLYDCPNVSEIVIPSTMKTLGGGSFRKCTSLEEITIPESVTTIGGHVFMGDEALVKVNIPEGVTALKNNLFDGCTSLEELDIPDSVTEIQEQAFRECESLKELDIPDGVTEIGEACFAYCDSLKKLVIPDGVTTIGKNTFLQCESLEEVVLPEKLTELGAYAFYGSSMLKKIVIPDGVPEIGDMTFARCNNLSEVIIPDSVTSIGDNAFRECVSLTELELPDTITYIGEEAFRECRYLEKMNLPKNLETLDGYALFNCHVLKEVDLPESLTTLKEYALYGCTALTEIIVPKNITKIEQFTFYGCTNAEYIQMQGDVTSIGPNAFADCMDLTNINLPKTVTEISEYAFERCENLKGITLPAGISKIENYTFRDCTKLSKVNLPEKLTKIGMSAFANCNELKEITVPKSVTSISSSALPTTTKLLCYKDSYGVTFAKNQKRLYAFVDGTEEDNLIQGEIKDDVTDAAWSINRMNGEMKIEWTGVFPAYTAAKLPWKSAVDYVESVEINGMVTEITANAFTGCENLKKLIIYNRNCDLSAMKLSGKPAIYGFKGSTAESYALKHGCTFVSIDGSHTHTFDQGVTTMYPSCIHTGTRILTCETCAYQETEILPVLAHTYSTDWTIDQPATVSVAGSKSRHCTECDTKTDVTAIPMASQAVLSEDTYTYDGKKKSPSVIVVDAEGNAISEENYTVTEPAGRTNAGEYVYTVTFEHEYEGVQELTMTIAPKKLTKMTLSVSEYIYNGSAKKPKVTVKSGTKTVVSKKTTGNANIKITYAKGRKNVGTYKVTVKGQGNYTGTLTKSFEINPKGTTVSKLTKGKKAFTVKWKKVSTQATGYEIMYAKNKKFSSGKKTIKVKSYKTTSKKIAKLKSKQTYYVKIRTYKTVNGKKYYSAWSGTKSVKVK